MSFTTRCCRLQHCESLSLQQRAVKLLNFESHLVRPLKALAGAAPGHGSLHHYQLLAGVLQDGIQLVLPEENVHEPGARLQVAPVMIEASALLMNDSQERHWHGGSQAEVIANAAHAMRASWLALVRPRTTWSHAGHASQISEQQMDVTGSACMPTSLTRHPCLPRSLSLPVNCHHGALAACGYTPAWPAHAQSMLVI